MHVISRLIIPLLSVFAPLSCATSSSSAHPGAADILYWPVTSSQPEILARISYDPASLKSDVVSYSPPTAVDTEARHASEADPRDLARVGLFTSTPTNPKQWVGSLTSVSSLAASQHHKPTLRIHIGPSNEIYHVSWEVSSSSGATSSSAAGLNVEVVSTEAGPRPHLNRPVVVGPDGKNLEEVVEKTFFQKYWWVFLVITFLAMSGSGEGQ
ncbi:uncharacterized protein ACLA_053660 [Aspergillus clavatus NRRL 1]|uniref:ER membrane protein complex subunit 10 n=1 Tax=Aspergillus clavatus (strain ATCC 1007 / CBS 513.65 / DSM 816 / NCTC 3887 / NRRL 1 / QM 1276 / 107) TaxID=344612 RepID=A1C8Z6_ASPCL|nr:uncharacterized protein ACLA_053660 [Aspergillus clavatus NRRL 1]EAW13320.1 conserved hypothetical protein [Aspergillus clavatus NRRL 1]